MSKSYRLVVFDWEGTLGDSLGQIIHTVAREAKKLGFGEINEPLARQSVELGLVKALKKTFPQLDESEQAQLLQAVHHSLLAPLAKVYLIPGAIDFIKRLKQAGINLAIATNKGYQSLQRDLQLCELDSYFKVTRSAGQVPAKPCVQMLEEILAEFNVGPEEALMIGDSISDMEMAKRLSVDAIAVNFYHQSEIGLHSAGALEVFDNYEKLASYLKLPKIKEEGV